MLTSRKIIGDKKMKTIYGGLENEFSDYSGAAIAVLPVPYDGTSTWIKGADKGPEALLEALFAGSDVGRGGKTCR